MNSGFGSRVGLLERIRKAEPRLVVVEAAPGWGKSFLARQLCNETVAHAMLSFGLTDGVEDAETRLSTALPPDWGAVKLAVLDGIDGVVRNGGRKLIRRLIATLPENRLLVLTSRQTLDLGISDFLAPHEVLVLGRDDLSLSRDEVRDIIAETPMPKETLERAVERTAGWPVIALLFARLAREDRLEEALNDPSSHRLDSLHRYIEDHVLPWLPTESIPVFVACAALGECTIEEICAAVGSDARATIDVMLEEMTRKGYRLFTTHGRMHRLHETAAGAMLALFPHEVREMRIRAADALSAKGRHVRGAGFAVAALDYELAAKALDAAGRRSSSETVSDEYHAVADALPLEYIFASQHIFLEYFCNRRTRSQPYALLERVRSYCDQLTPDVDPFIRYSARIALMALLRMTYHAREAEVQAQKCEVMGRAFPEARDRHAFLRTEKAVIAAWRGRAEDAEQLWSDFDSTEEPGKEWFSYTRFFSDFAVAAQRGDANELMQLTQWNLDNAKSWNDPPAVAQALQAMLIANATIDPSTLPQLLTHLEAAIASFPSRSEAREFAERFMRPYEGGAEYPTQVGCLLSIHAAVSQTDYEVGRRLLQSSLDGFDLMGHRYWQIVARLVAARISGFDEHALLRECVTLCNEMQLPDVSAQVASIADGTNASGPLSPFLDFVNASPLFERTTLFRLRILDRKVWRDGAEVHIRHREFELLAHLALANGPVSAATLCATMWPGSDETAAMSALRMSVHRLRKQLDANDAVISLPAGYQLGQQLSVDILEAEGAYAALRRLPTLNTDDTTSLHALFQYLCTISIATLESESWHDKIAGRVEELRRGAGMLLAKTYLRVGESLRALEVGEALLHFDPLDEEAVATSVQALTASGDKSAAVRVWHQYVKRLSKDYGTQPSISLAELTLA